MVLNFFISVWCLVKSQMFYYKRLLRTNQSLLIYEVLLFVQFLQESLGMTWAKINKINVCLKQLYQHSWLQHMTLKKQSTRVDRIISRQNEWIGCHSSLSVPFLDKWIINILLCTRFTVKSFFRSATSLDQRVIIMTKH